MQNTKLMTDRVFTNTSPNKTIACVERHPMSSKGKADYCLFSSFPTLSRSY